MINPLPFQPVKVHCPPPRSDILSRERLNGWLDVAAAGRVALVIAEAGFGKTTLLADWARHTQRLTAWYRLENDDRDWLTFIRHLVATGRELDPEFGPDTFALLQSLGPGGPTRAELIASIARELARFGVASATGLTLIFDDFHSVDGCPETDPIVAALLDRTAPGFSVVIASRVPPGLPMGKVRARGGVDDINGDALCFDPDETERLFRDAYQHPLQPDIAAELCVRTNGWAALLTLVRASLADGGPDPRTLISHLSASSGDLYEFLAEEVLAGLRPELAWFLTRVSILMAVDVESAMLVDDRPADDLAESIRECERLGLLSRPDRESPHRFHPLVREFLVTRLTEEIGAAAVRDLHRAIGQKLSSTNWHLSAWHFVQGDEPGLASAVIDGAIELILATGAFERVVPFLQPAAGDPNRAVALILQSRIELDRGDGARANAHARRAVDASGVADVLGTALLNLGSVLSVGGLADEAVAVTKASLGYQLAPHQRYVAQATVMVWEASHEGNLEWVVDELAALAAAQERARLTRYAGISRLNLAGTLPWLGRAKAALKEATLAELHLGGARSPSVERVAATAMRAVALAQLGRISEAKTILTDEMKGASLLAREELAVESARIHGDFGLASDAISALSLVDPERLAGGYKAVWALARGVAAMRQGDLKTASAMCDRLQVQRCPDAAGKFRAQLLRARLEAARKSADSLKATAELRRIAVAHRSRPMEFLAAILEALQAGEPIGPQIERLETDDRYCLSLIAEELSGGLSLLGARAMELVREEASLRPERWVSALRLHLDRADAAPSECAELLAEIGGAAEAQHLRALSVSKKAYRPAALRITRRLAAPLYLADIGPVDLRLGGLSIGRGLRRKVLAVLCFLSSRPGMASTKDEALDALWPDLPPDTAANSLHQTIYFARRIFEPDYREGMSAGYVLFDGDVVSLGADLVDSASRRCWRLLAKPDKPGADVFEQVLDLYQGKYALDFAYEEWALAYRENLHAAVLSTGEAAMASGRASRQFDRSIQIGHALLAIDPDADGIELELLRAYKASGRQAAAAEQYAHYAAYVRGELGADPPAFGDI